jgi:hypothetical protein
MQLLSSVVIISFLAFILDQILKWFRSLLRTYQELALGFFLGLDEDSLFFFSSSSSSSRDNDSSVLLGRKRKKEQTEELQQPQQGNSETIDSSDCFRLESVQNPSFFRQKQFLSTIVKNWCSAWSAIDDFSVIFVEQPDEDRLSVLLIKEMTLFINEIVGLVTRKDHRSFLFKDCLNYFNVFLCRYVMNQFPTSIISFSEQEVCHLEALEI